MKVLGQDHLSRLATDGGGQEPILRRLSVDKSAKRMRAVLAAPPCVWDRSLVQWLSKAVKRCCKLSKAVTRPGVDKVKPKVWFKYSL